MSSELPILTSGRAGRINHAMVNRVFRATEKVEQLPPASNAGAGVDQFPIMAKLVSPQPSGWSGGLTSWRWTSVRAVYGTGTWSADPSGVHSQLWSPEKLVVVASSLTAGAIVELWPMPSTHGDLGDVGIQSWFVGVPIDPGASVVEAGVIVEKLDPSEETLNQPGGYLVKLVTDASLDLLDKDGPGGTVVALNMFELSAQLQLHVQNDSPGTKVLIPLAQGDPTGPLSKLRCSTVPIYQFTMPNAYQVVCA